MKRIWTICLLISLILLPVGVYGSLPGLGTYELCTISGSKGNTVSCPLTLASATALLQPPTALEFRISWDPAKVKIRPFEDEFCWEEACYPIQIPYCTETGGCAWGALNTGHTVAAAPLDFANWFDQGTVIIVNMGDPSKTITHAYVDKTGALNGSDATFLTAIFELTDDIPAESPVSIYLSEVVFSSADAFTMPFTFAQLPAKRVFVTTLPGGVDNSGVIDVSDAILTLQLASGINPAIPVYQEADINANGKIGLAEAIYSLQKAANLR